MLSLQLIHFYRPNAPIQPLPAVKSKAGRVAGLKSSNWGTDHISHTQLVDKLLLGNQIEFKPNSCEHSHIQINSNFPLIGSDGVKVPHSLGGFMMLFLRRDAEEPGKAEGSERDCRLVPRRKEKKEMSSATPTAGSLHSSLNGECTPSRCSKFARAQQICGALIPFRVNIETRAGFCIHMWVMCRVMNMASVSQQRLRQHMKTKQIPGLNNWQNHIQPLFSVI